MVFQCQPVDEKWRSHAISYLDVATVLLFLCLLIGMARAEESVTINGYTYQNVRWGTVTPTSVTIFHKSGIATIPLDNLPEELQKRFRPKPAVIPTPKSAPLREEASTGRADTSQNKLVFDNQSGEPALVKLLGPAAAEVERPDVEVPVGGRRGVAVQAGNFFVKIRYGVSGKYHYAKGQEFEITDTATTRSEVIITLHKVVAGNYESHPISENEFDTASATAVPATNAAPKASGGLPATKPSKTQLTQMDDNSFARLTAALWVASDIERDRAHIILQMANFKVSDNEESRTILGLYGITPEQFEREYLRRMFTLDNEINDKLMGKLGDVLREAQEKLKPKQ